MADAAPTAVAQAASPPPKWGRTAEPAAAAAPSDGGGGAADGGGGATNGGTTGDGGGGGTATAADAAGYEPRTLFISNLAFTATAADLADVFASAVGVPPPAVAVRLPRRADGASKGFAYVELPTDAAATAALRLHARARLHGRLLWVRRSRPPSLPALCMHSLLL